MTKRTPLLGLAAALAVLLAGCSMSSPMPEPITDAAMESYLQSRVDAAWMNTGLDGVMERPEDGASSMVARFSSSGFNGMSECMAEFGVESWGWSEIDGGPRLETFNGVQETPELQLQFFGCFQRHPMSPTFSNLILSPEQIDYLYDYYQRQVVPCLRVNGFELADVPTRRQFEESAGLWSPYFAVTSGFATGDDLDRNVQKCGDPLGGIALDRPAAR